MLCSAAMNSLPSNEEEGKQREREDRCQRWRTIAIDQLGYAVNLTLTFTIATLGY
jgi:hypothetical protein